MRTVERRERRMLRIMSLISWGGILLILLSVMLQVPYQSTVDIPLRMNNVPHPREMRQFFYRDATAAVQAAVEAGQMRMSVR